MDTETLDTTAPSPQQKPVRLLKVSVLSLFLLVVCMGAVYYWQHQKVKTLTEQVNNMQVALIKTAAISRNNLEARMALPNIVDDTADSPVDLIAFLGADNTQCYKNEGKGFYKVLTASGNFAVMEYGCTPKGGKAPAGSTQSHILAKKVNNTWSLISPTNQWQEIDGQDTPSCTMVNDNKVSKLVVPKCWQGNAQTGSTANATPAVVPVTNQ